MGDFLNLEFLLCLKIIKLFKLNNFIVSFFRYIMLEQKKAEDFGITEDDVSEIRQDINKFRFELLDILRKNKFDIGKIRSVGGCYGGRRAKQMERRIMKGFTLEIYDLLKDSLDKQDKNKSVDIFQVMAEAMQKTKSSQQPAIDFTSNSDYSPATVVAAGKFKRFLGKHLKSNGTEDVRIGGTNNNIAQYSSTTAPCSPIRQKEFVKLPSKAEHAGKIELCEHGPEQTGGDKDSKSGKMNNSDSLSCSKLTKNKKAGNITGGWI